MTIKSVHPWIYIEFHDLDLKEAQANVHIELCSNQSLWAL